MRLTVLSVKKITVASLLAAFAVILSYVESVSGINAIMPVAGIKLGIANIAVVLVSYHISLNLGIAVSLIRVFVNALLFGTPTTLVFSLFGAVLSFLFIAFSKKVLKNKVSLVGVCIGSSAMHITGQLIAASFMIGDLSVIRLLPAYLVISSVSGIFTGIISEVISSPLKRIMKGEKSDV